MMPKKALSGAKAVVYLWGAGATHAEAQYAGAPINLLMRDIPIFGPGVTKRILERTGKRATADFDGVVDIEKLISLLAASGVSDFSELADKLRMNYFNELRSSLVEAQLLDRVRLATTLFEMHKDGRFQNDIETLSGVLTTNHDGLLQVVFQQVFGGVNLGFPFVSDDFSSKEDSVPLLSLHGSFTWQFGSPIRVARLRKNSKYSRDTVWIPPTILKESKMYPFNKLAGLAYELLAKRCDVLRVVGASLTQNDWNILSLIFNAQRHREYHRGSAFRVELIMPHSAGETVKSDCGYLKNVFSIGYLSEGDFSGYRDEKETSDMGNPLGYWLGQKLEHHTKRSELTGKIEIVKPSELR